MKYAVDRIIDNIAIIENINTLEKKEIDITILPFSIYEGAILTYQDNIYKLDEPEEEKRRRIILEKFNKLRNNN